MKWVRPLGEDWTLRFIPSIGIDGTDFTLGDSTDLSQYQILAEIRAELLWSPAEALTVTSGLDFIGGNYWFDAALPINPDSFADYDPLSEREPFSIDGAGLGGGPDLYVRADVRPLPDRERMLLSAGVRANVVRITGSDNPDTLFSDTAFDPRVSGRFRVTEGGALKFGAGVYHQPPLPFEIWRPEGTTEVGFERVYTAEVGWQQQATDVIRGDVSVFYKWLDDLIVQNPDFESLESQYFVNTGVGRVYGLEAIVRKDPVGPLFGWISYTLSRSERNDDPDATPSESDATFPGDPPRGDWYLFALDQTHILTAVAGYDLPRDIGVSGRVQYVTGNPYTPYSGGVYDVDQSFYYPYAAGDYNASRLPAYFAVDARVDKLFTFKTWQLELYVDMLNVVRGLNPEFELNNYDYTERSYIRSLPFIPSPGFNATFNF